MGDSITEGQYVEHSLRWSELISTSLMQKYDNFSSRFITINSGISGETTRQGLERFPKSVQVHKPAIMTLQFGLNDCNCWETDNGYPRVSELAYRYNLIEMIERSKLFGTKHIILSTNHKTLRKKILACGENLEQRRVKYDKIVREVAKSTNVTLCDMANHFDGLTNEELESFLLPEPDLLHLSLEGHKFYATILEPFIETALNQLFENENKKNDHFYTEQKDLVI